MGAGREVLGIQHVVHVALVVRLGLGRVVVIPVPVGHELHRGVSARISIKLSVIPAPLPPAATGHSRRGGEDMGAHLVHDLALALGQLDRLLEDAGRIPLQPLRLAPVVKGAGDEDLLRRVFPYAVAPAISLRAPVNRPCPGNARGRGRMSAGTDLQRKV